MPETVIPITDSEKNLIVKCENNSEDEQVAVVTICDTNMEYSSGADSLRRNKQVRQDPTSHRIIEKRRRDRMNNCLADLSRLIPPDYLKKGRGRIEKTEIIEMATRYIKILQSKRNSSAQENSPSEHFRRGYQECLSEALRYLVEKQGYYASDTVCVQFINHLQHHCGKINKGEINLKQQQPTVDSSSQAGSNNHISHKQQFISSHDSQHMNQRDCESNTKDTSRHKHSSSFSMCNDEKSYNYSVDSEQNQTAFGNGGNISPEGSVMGRRTSFSQQNPSLGNNNCNFVSTDHSNNLEDEDGSTRVNIKNMMYMDKDDYVQSQDSRNDNDYSTVQYNHSQNTSESSLRNIRKQDLMPNENVSFNVDVDNHSYKFKNTIKQRFSQSQSTGYRSSSPSDGLTNIGSTSSNYPSLPRREQTHGSIKFNHKRRKVSEHHNRHNISDSYDQSSSGTNSSESNGKHINSMYKLNKLIDSKDSLLEDSIKSDILSIGKHNSNGKVCINKKYEDKFSCPIGVPIFALHAKGSFYVPMNVDYDSLLPFLGPYDLLDVAAFQPNISLHPVTINVNFQPAFMNNKSSLQNIRSWNDKKTW